MNVGTGRVGRYSQPRSLHTRQVARSRPWRASRRDLARRSAGTTGRRLADGDTGGHAMALRWNGKSWKLQRPRSDPTLDATTLNGVSCPSAHRCVAVGSADMTGYAGDAPPEHVVIERWDGARWATQKAKLSQASGANTVWTRCRAHRREPALQWGRPTSEPGRWWSALTEPGGHVSPTSRARRPAVSWAESPAARPLHVSRSGARSSEGC